jgi:hypothetical protein
VYDLATYLVAFAHSEYGALCFFQDCLDRAAESLGPAFFAWELPSGTSI